MPTYDYACRACGHTFEEFQGISEPLLRKCPACRRLELERLIGSGAGIVFKGSGFYETDYKRAGSKDGKDGSSSSAPAAKPSGKDGAGGKSSTTPDAGSSPAGGSSSPGPAGNGSSSGSDGSSAGD